MFQSPRGDFGFLKRKTGNPLALFDIFEFQSPRGDFGFLKESRNRFFCRAMLGFNPLAGILVF